MSNHARLHSIHGRARSHDRRMDSLLATQSIITSLLPAGLFFGALLQSLTSDRLGRRGSIIFWSTIFSTGITIQVASFDLAQITVGRFITGLGVGALSAIVPLSHTSGFFLAYIVDLGTHHFKSSASWRFHIGLQLIWGAFLIVGGCLPESPRLLFGRGDEPKALKAVARLNERKVGDPLTRDVIKDLEEAIREENEGGKAGWLECFSTRSMMWKRTLNGCMVQFLQQLNGQNFYYYYGAVFFESAQVPLSTYSIQSILGGISLATVIPVLWTIEHVGRRKSLLIGTAIQAACALIAGLLGHYYTDVGGVTESMVKTGGNVLIAFAPLLIRPKAIALASFVNWLWNFLLSYFSPLIADDIGPLILLIFFGCLVFAFFYIFFMLPETRGITLEEIDELYRSKVPAWKSNSWKPSSHHAALDALEGQSRKPIEGSARAPDTLDEKKPADEHIENAPVAKAKIGEEMGVGGKVLFKMTWLVRQVVVV
ncbi:uncharacterized protein IAS62_006461 [Cryptococcus decagattii]|uniref:Major facilitator superfamily (MFS) profile domain-containing protein n=1 Tax=Cryptococcus decagattii TaxID=1859122 RepID=A0ABZ2B2P2_9TREE